MARKNKRVYGTNIYQDWVNSGRLPEVLAFISECAKKLVSQFAYFNLIWIVIL